MCTQSDADRELERTIRANVWAMAEAIPKDCRISMLAVELVRSMGERDDEQKVASLSMTYVAALKMIAELAPAAPDGMADS